MGEPAPFQVGADAHLATMSPASATHLVLIPSYNAGESVFNTVREARAFWQPVWVVVDGSTDGTNQRLEQSAACDPGLRVLVLPRNQGKGAAILHGLREAEARGFTHVLTMDADGQHPSQCIRPFMAASQTNLRALVLGTEHARARRQHHHERSDDRPTDGVLHCGGFSHVCSKPNA